MTECLHCIKQDLLVLGTYVSAVHSRLDRDESRNFFSRSRIKFLKVEYREMILGHGYTVRFITCCKRREASDCPTVGEGLGTTGKTAATAFEVSCRGWPVAGTIFYETLSVFSRHFWLVHSHVSTVSCAHISEQFHCTATTAARPI